MKLFANMFNNVKESIANYNEDTSSRKPSDDRILETTRRFPNGKENFGITRPKEEQALSSKS